MWLISLVLHFSVVRNNYTKKDAERTLEYKYNWIGLKSSEELEIDDDNDEICSFCCYSNCD